MTVPGFSAWRAATTTIPLADGVRGTAQTIGLIRRLIDLGVKDPRIRRVATDLVGHLAPFNDNGEVRAIFAAVIPGGRLGIRFVRDMVGRYDGLSGEYIGKETLQPAHVTLETQAGDCDDINGILLPALLGSIGYPTRAVTIAPPHDPENFSHIYIEVEAPPGSDRWIPLDAAREGAAWGNTPDRYGRLERWPLTGGAERLGRVATMRDIPETSQRKLVPRFGLTVAEEHAAPQAEKGLTTARAAGRPSLEGRRRLVPRYGLGDFNVSTLLNPETIAAITGGTAQIIGAARTSPNVLAYGYGPGAGVSPYGPGITASTQVAGSSNLLLVAGLAIAGIFGLVLLSKR